MIVKRAHGRAQKYPHGFSLLEVLLAMMLMTTALILLANSWSAAFGRVKKTQINFEIAALLERKMNDYERKYRGKAVAEIPDEEADDFGSDYPQYSWKMTSKKFDMPDISSTLTSQSGGADSNTIMMVKKFFDHVSQSTKELTITIIYKNKKKNIEVTTTTYFVDYDKSIDLGLGGAPPQQ